MTRARVDIAAALADGLAAPTGPADVDQTDVDQTSGDDVVTQPPAKARAAATGTARGARRDGSPRRRGQPARPTARELATPVTKRITREALKVDVPTDLALLDRLHRRQLDTGELIRDQVAIAVDEWLTAEGY